MEACAKSLLEEFQDIWLTIHLTGYLIETARLGRLGIVQLLLGKGVDIGTKRWELGWILKLL